MFCCNNWTQDSVKIRVLVTERDKVIQWCNLFPQCFENFIVVATPFLFKNFIVLILKALELTLLIRGRLFINNYKVWILNYNISSFTCTNTNYQVTKKQVQIKTRGAMAPRYFLSKIAVIQHASKELTESIFENAKNGRLRRSRKN